MKRSSPLHVLGAACLIFSVLRSGVPLAHAQVVQAEPPGPGERVRLVGSVINLHGAATDPDSFSLQLGMNTTDLRTDARTVFAAQSAEAQVEGLVNGDYATVTAHRTKHDWVASRIQFDVLPVPPLQEWQGTVLWINPAGTRFQLKGRNVETNVDRTMFMRVSPIARFLLQGRPAEGSLSLSKGNVVQVMCVPRGGWTAFEIDVKSTGTGVRSGDR